MDNQTQPSEQNEPAVVKHAGLRDFLVAARALIENEDDWCRGHYIDDDGRMCAAGALRNCTRGYDERMHVAFDLLSEQVRGNIISYNDEHTHAEVLAAFDRAIEQCETLTEQASAQKAAP